MGPGARRLRLTGYTASAMSRSFVLGLVATLAALADEPDRRLAAAGHDTIESYDEIEGS